MRAPFADDFDGPDLDPGVLIPHDLPQWSSRAASAATYVVEDSVLRLTIPPEQGVWCAGDHEPPLRASGHDLVVREAQAPRWGWTPHFGRIEVRARMQLSPRSMASVWLIGLEDAPERCGEIWVFEVFANAPPPSARASSRSATRASPSTSPPSRAPWTSATRTSTRSTGAPARSTSSSTGTSCAASARPRPTPCRSSSRCSTSRSGRRTRPPDTCPRSSSTGWAGSRPGDRRRAPARADRHDGGLPGGEAGRHGDAGWALTGIPWPLLNGATGGAPEDVAAGVTLLLCGGGVASLYAVGTLAAARRRGIGRALTLVPLHASGERVAGLLSSDEGSLVYRALGFEPRGAVTRWRLVGAW